MLETSKINLFYGKSQILYDIDLEAQKGQVPAFWVQMVWAKPV